MKLPEYVKPFPKFRSPHNRAENGYVSYRKKIIYLSPKIYNDLLTNKPEPFSISVLRHEEYHVKDLEKIGTIKYILGNTFLPKFRLLHELAAYQAEFKYLKSNKQTIDLDRIARNLSGLKYYWTTNYPNAKKLVEKAWKEA